MEMLIEKSPSCSCYPTQDDDDDVCQSKKRAVCATAVIGHWFVFVTCSGS